MKTSEKVLAGATLGLIGLSLGWTQVGKPVLDDWSEARAHVEKAQADLKRANDLIKRKKDVEGEHAAIRGALAPPVSPDEPADPNQPASETAIPGFLAHLRSLTDAAGIRPTSLRYVRTDPYDAFSELRFELKARARLKEIQDFLVRMTASEWYLRVQALQFMPQNDGTIEADMSLVALATRDADEEPPAKTPPRRGEEKGR